MTTKLTPLAFGRTLSPTMQTGFDEAFRRVKELVAIFRDNEKFYLSQDNQANLLEEFKLAV